MGADQRANPRWRPPQKDRRDAGALGGAATKIVSAVAVYSNWIINGNCQYHLDVEPIQSVGFMVDFFLLHLLMYHVSQLRSVVFCFVLHRGQTGKSIGERRDRRCGGAAGRGWAAA